MATADARQAEIVGPAANPTDRAVPRLRFPPCQSCGGPITRKGYAKTNVTEAIARARDRKRGDKSAEEIPWHFLHRDCDPDAADTGWYFLGVKQARTSRDLLVEVLKLSLKPWYEHTAWRPMVAEILAASRSHG